MPGDWPSTHKPAAGRSSHQPAAADSPAALLAEAQGYGGHYHDTNDNRVVFQGTAIVVNGIVSAMSGPCKEKWEDGTFEYVLEYYRLRTDNTDDDYDHFFFTDVTAVSGALDPNVPWVQDRTYK